MGAVLLGGGCYRLTVTWQEGSCGNKYSALTVLLPSPSSCPHTWTSGGLNAEGRGSSPGKARGRDEGAEGCLVLSFVELGEGRSEGRKASPDLSFPEGTVIILSALCAWWSEPLQSVCA